MQMCIVARSQQTCQLSVAEVRDDVYGRGFPFVASLDGHTSSIYAQDMITADGYPLIPRCSAACRGLSRVMLKDTA
jgi:hypothetical protein